MDNIDFLNRYLKDLGYGEEEITIYTNLLIKGEMTILNLSRSSGIERTKLYRLLEGLIEKGIVVERLEFNKRFLQACDLSVLQRHAEEVINKTTFISKNLPSFLNIVGEYRQSSLPTNVKFYKGVEGIKQVLWNELRAEKEILVYSYRILNEITGDKFFHKWSSECVVRGIEIRDLRSVEFLKSEMMASGDLMPFVGDEIRYIEPEELDITIEMDIYNDTVVIFNWLKGDVYGVEITDAKFAKMQRQIFKAFWGMAKPLSQKEWEEKVEEMRKKLHKKKAL
ncbi:hypothetical protein HYV12_01095 [Candidatus Dojkabacteria bacterium]|nr:hypothetical protein [Candidatus Dojkabacteria bacterium]